MQKNIYLTATGLTPVDVIQETTYTDDAGTVHTLFVHDNPEEDEVKEGMLYACSHEETGMKCSRAATPEAAQAGAMSNFIFSDNNNNLQAVINRAKDQQRRTDEERTQRQQAEQDAASIPEDVQEKVRDYAKGLKEYYQSDDFKNMYFEIAHQQVTEENIKDTLVNADDMPHETAATFADLFF